jgi:hypothetical protein
MQLLQELRSIEEVVNRTWLCLRCGRLRECLFLALIIQWRLALALEQGLALEELE